MNPKEILLFLRSWCKEHKCGDCVLFAGKEVFDNQNCIGSEILVEWTDEEIERAAKLIERNTIKEKGKL